jgi:hypothetical protein
MGAGVAQSVVSDYRLDDQGSNVEVKNELELYCSAVWRLLGVVGQLYFFL